MNALPGRSHGAEPFPPAGAAGWARGLPLSEGNANYLAGHAAKEDRMTLRSRFISGFALTVFLAACGPGGDPIGPDVDPSLSGGLVTGSNGTGSGGGTGGDDGTQSTTTSTAETDSTGANRTGGLVTGSN
jgi:hypothetical protein